MIPLNEPFLTGDEWVEVKKCFDTGWVSTAGPQIDEFGKKFAEFVRAPYAVPVASGTAALHLALLAAGIKPGDSVIVPSMTFVASVNSVVYAGANPVFVESDPRTFGNDVADTLRVAKALIAKGQKPRAVLAVHLYGHAVNLDPLIEFCRAEKILLIEDAAESLGTLYRGAATGTFGDLGCYSFNGNKIMTTGGGGMVVTRNQALAEKVRYLSEQARDKGSLEWSHGEIGFNYRLGNIQAAFGLAQLKHLPEFIRKKKNIAARYATVLENLPGILPNVQEDWCDNSFWLYSILVDEKVFGMESRELMNGLIQRGVGSRPFFKPLHLLPPYQKWNVRALPVAEKLWRQGIHLPSSVGLSDEQIETVIRNLKELHQTRKAVL